MSFRDKAETGAVDTRKNSGGSGSNDSETETLDGIEVDFNETPFVAINPTTFVTGEFPEDEGNPIIRFRSPKYNDGRQDQGYLGLVVDDPEIVADEAEGTEDTVVLRTDENDTTDYRVFNEDDAETKVAGDMGVKYGDRLYEGEVVDDIDADRIILKVTGSSSKNVAKRFDKKGAVEAGMDEETGNVNDGLIEYKPWDIREEDDDYTSRYARDPELKEGLYGQRIGLFLGRREELDDENTGYVGIDVDDGDVSDATSVLGEAEDVTKHNDPSKASYLERVRADERYPMGWYVTFDIESEEEISIEETDQKVYGYTYLDDEWGQFDPEAGRMPDDQWEWVENYVEEANNGNVDADEDTIVGFIEEDVEEGEAFEDAPSEAERTEMVSAIQNQV